MGERSARRLLPYARQLVRLAVCDVLEQEGCLDFARDEPGGAILADVTVYGNPGRFSIAVRDGTAGRSCPCPSLGPGRGCPRRGGAGRRTTWPTEWSS